MDEDEVQALLSVFANYEIQQDFDSTTPNDRVYSGKADKLADVNV